MNVLKIDQQLNLLDLYEEEICARISQNLNIDGLGPLKEFLHEEELVSLLSSDGGGPLSDVDELKLSDNNEQNDVTVQNENQEEDAEKKEAAARVKCLLVAQKIWDKINESALRMCLYPRVLEFLLPIDDELHKSICVESYTTEFVAGFSKMLHHSPALLSLFSCSSLEKEELKRRWLQFSDNLKASVQGFELLVDPLAKRVQSDTVDVKRAMKILLRSIPVSNINGYEHVLNAISKCDFENAKQFVEDIYPEFVMEYEYIKSSAFNRHNYFYIVRPEDDISEVIEMAMKNDLPPPGANVFNARLGNVPRIHVRACTIDTCQEFPLNLRPYQKELITEAVSGKNVVICAPTGSGKTIVAAYIIREHLFSALQKNHKAKACFVVPTTSLVVQQKRLFNKYIGHFAKVRGLSGSGVSMSLNNPIRAVMEYADVIVITPQLLINELERRPIEINCDTFVPFTLEMFTLLIFDESHHSKDDHPYNVLMKSYHEMKLTGAFNKKLPQIIGMTASLGIGGAASKNLDETVRYTLDICTNLDTHWISCVRRHRESLRAYLPMVIEEITFVPHEGSCDFLAELLNQTTKLKSLMNVVPEANQKEVEEQLNDQNSRNPLIQCFEVWLGTLKQQFLKTSRLLSDVSRERLMFYTEQLLIVYYSIIWLKLFGVRVALKYIQKEEGEKLLSNIGASEMRDDLNEWIANLQNIVTQRGVERQNSELLDRLIAILNDQFEKNANSRVLIFIQKRDQCELLSTLLNEQTKHRTDFFTGQASREAGGQNARMQKAKLDDFSRGEIKILCATTVAEEGIDISACNLIVHYNYVTNEIARVQRRGRCRARDARAILLTCDASIKEKEEQNALRERLMYEALEELSQWSQAAFLQKVEMYIHEMNKKRKEAEALEAEKIAERRKFDSLFRIVCSACNHFLGLSSKISLVGSTYVIADKEFWVRTKVVASKLPPEKAESRECKGQMPHIGEHRCCCTQKLGRIVQYRGGVLLPNLNVDKIVFIRCQSDGNEIPGGSGERRKERKWAGVSKNLFCIEKITTLQLVEMKDAPGKPDALLRNELLE